LKDFKESNSIHEKSLG